ncbi:MAG TPA: TonB-dependent receptor, partial [Pyrinomonadaceae bacterium]|nr:TonB-dependent receptor [Pyrinomonadaceae bacterium]
LKFLRFSLAALLLVALSALAVMAQSTVTGAIGGVITNPNKEVVPGATISVRNIETNNEETATSDGEGRFRVVNLQPGTYTVTINSQGFSPFTQEAVVVEVGRVTSLDVPLSVTGVTGTVQVTSDAPVINTTQQDFSTNINQTSINELPVNGRRWSNFAILTPGTVPDGNFGLISFRGISGLMNNNTVDGGDNNQAFFSEERGRTRVGYSISQAAIREFQVNTSNYSAEYGRSAGGVNNAVTKSGTNEFHGQGFYYQRNNKWGARNPLSFQSILVNGVVNRVPLKPEDVRHQFGGAIGGPIVPNKAFFFFSYDEQRRNFPGVSIFTSPSYLSTVNTTLLTAAVRGLTTDQINSSLSFINSLTGVVPRKGNQRIFLPKLDWNINSNNTFTATYNRLRWASPAGVQTAATVTRDRAGFGDDFVRVDSLNMRLASTLSSTLVNEARFQWAHELDSQIANPPLPGEPTTANGNSPQVALTNGLTFGKATSLDRKALPDERRFQFADTVTLSAGNHTVKWGGDVNRVRDIDDNLFTGAGSYAYSNINDFIVDYVNFTSGGTLRAANKQCATSTRLAGKCYTSNFAQGFGPPRFQLSTTDVAFFVQDDWRTTSRLTLNLGLRYEYQRFPEPFLINSALPQTANRPNDKNNFGPRAGFAYDVNGDGKTSVRGGYGIYYGRVIGSTIINSLINTGLPTGQVVSSVAATSAASPIFPNVLPSAPSGTASVQYFARGFQNPMVHQGDFIIERQVAHNTVVSASYLFAFGKHLPNFVDINLNPPTVTRTLNIVDGPFAGQKLSIPYFLGPRPNPSFGLIMEIRSNIESKYHALVLQANRRLTDGLQFQANYTLSRAQDNGQGSTTFTPGFSVPFNPFDQAGENGLSSFDRRHKFVASVVYNTSFASLKDNRVGRAIFNGWTIAPIVSIFSGARYTGTISGGGNVSAAFGTSPAGGTINGSNGSLRFPLVPNNFFKQPPIKYVDLRLSRRFSITEKTKLELLAEGFNIFNRTEVTSVNNTLYNATASGSTVNLTYNTPFGTTTGADGFFFRERQVQLAVRFEF